MRYQKIQNTLFANNRERLAKLLNKDSIAIFNSNDIMPTNADGVMKFRQNNDLFYMTGVDQEESILLIFPNCHNKKHREILFLKQTDENIAIWEGNKLTKEQAKDVSGIETIYWTSQFESTFGTLVVEASTIYLNTNEHPRNSVLVESRDRRFISWCLNKYPLHRYERLAPLMQQLRIKKSKLEIELVKVACDITGKAFLRALKFIQPQVYEYEIEAEITHEFLINRSRGHAYQPIIASGPDACVLHYIDNNKQCQKDELVLMDFGAEYANYNADLTRVVPVSGKFSPRQKAIYKSVLNVHNEAIKMLVIGGNFEEYDKIVGEIMEEELVKLGLINMNQIKNQDPSKPVYKRYFMHGISHFLGLDVHDVGSKHQLMSEGMLLTVEPGIYIKEEGIGIRLENNILITKKGPLNLMSHIPIEIEEIEDLMNQ